MSKAQTDDFNPSTHEDETRERWGDTQAFKESHLRTTGYTKTDYEEARMESDRAVQLLTAAMDAGLPPDSQEAMQAARAHQDAISHWYYECTDDIHLGLADMYLADERFTQYYDSRRPGLARYLHDAIYAKSPGLIRNVDQEDI